MSACQLADTLNVVILHILEAIYTIKSRQRAHIYDTNVSLITAIVHQVIIILN